jgi:hypothetical protein
MSQILIGTLQKRNNVNLWKSVDEIFCGVIIEFSLAKSTPAKKINKKNRA